MKKEITYNGAKYNLVIENSNTFNGFKSISIDTEEGDEVYSTSGCVDVIETIDELKTFLKKKIDNFLSKSGSIDDVQLHKWDGKL